jgi:crotonobetainyl-CoA:carnitine CoA-transferase CaiB-like acyl-CoA transferase
VARDGTAKYVEVAEVDAAIIWNFRKVTAMASNLPYDDLGMRDQPRYQYYDTSDGNYVIFTALEDKVWRRFCNVIGRDDLYELGNVNPSDDPATTEKVRRELTDIFRARTRTEWTQFFIDTKIAGAPAFLGADLLDDPHVKARNLVYEQSESTGVPRMLRTCIKTKPDDGPPPSAAPAVGEHTDDILRTVLRCDDAEVKRLHADGVILPDNRIPRV